MLYGHAAQIYIKKKGKKKKQHRKKMEDNSGDIYSPFENGSLSTAYYKLKIKSSYSSSLKGILLYF